VFRDKSMLAGILLLSLLNISTIRSIYP